MHLPKSFAHIKEAIRRLKFEELFFLQLQIQQLKNSRLTSFPGYIFKIEAFIKDLENPDDMVKEVLEFQGIRTNKELREEYKKRKDKNKS